MEKQRKKQYVSVTARFDTVGNILPVKVLWEDGRRFDIDKIIDVRPCASLKCGGFGIRYTCRILGKETYIFREADRWYVEKIV